MIYRLNDTDCESVGLIETTEENENKITELWHNWYKEADEIDVDLFCDYLEEKGIVAERTYLIEIDPF